MYFCTGHMRQPFFSRAIPTYGVLPYSMMIQIKRTFLISFAILAASVSSGPLTAYSIRLTCGFMVATVSRDFEHQLLCCSTSEDRPRVAGAATANGAEADLAAMPK